MIIVCDPGTLVKTLTPFETSAHEAGHAVVGHVVGAEVLEVTILQDLYCDYPKGSHEYRQRIAHCSFDADGIDRIGPTAHLAILLAGDIGEMLLMDGNPRHDGDSLDMCDIKEVLKAAPLLPGMDLTESMAMRFRTAVSLAVGIIHEHRDTIERLALLLRKYDTLTGAEVKEAIEL